jgi:hypothetical protein
MEHAWGKPTILDVAQRASVSVGTVSNVLNGKVRGGVQSVLPAVRIRAGRRGVWLAIGGRVTWRPHKNRSRHF